MTLLQISSTHINLKYDCLQLQYLFIIESMQVRP